MTTDAHTPAPVLVTGANGFLGSHLVDELLERGHPVTALLRETSDDRWLRDRPVRIHRPGLFGDPQALAALVSGHRAVFHVAGAVRALDFAGFVHTNVTGTENLLRACLAAPEPPRRFVLASSVGATGPAPRGRLTEDTPPGDRTAYGRSKWQAEQLLLSHASRIEVAILRLTALYGPRDREMLPLFRAASRGILPVFGGPAQVFNLAHGRDAARALALAGEVPLSSAGVFLVGSGDEHTAAEIAVLLGELLHRRVRLVPVPRALLWSTALAGEVAGRLRRRPVMLTRQKLPELTGSWCLDLSRARSGLGFQATSGLREGLAETLAWYRAQGLL